MRLFVAIEFPEEVMCELEGIQQKMRVSAGYGRFVTRSNLHLTLQFLGEVSRQELGPIVSALHRVAKVQPAFSISLSGVGSFGKSSPFRVIWAGVDGDIPSLIRLQKNIASALGKVGFLQEARPYQPHITLGRDVELSGKEALGNFSKILAPVSFPVKQFVLKESKIEDDKLVYHSLHSFSLSY
jgi:2''-5'' RNA ligase